ncbi:exopolysaccharide biosynthesis protein [Palleronia sp. KMU-117]|uniref:exopolysaccharide biosynthesis protein n=1 Tax=Palleronia sp. KMU-117 TaxID=3434108 RepID=UPI003D72761D
MTNPRDIRDTGDTTLVGVIEHVATLAHNPTVSVREIVEGFGATSFVPALLVPALIVVSPLSGIPLLSTVCGTIIAIIAIQMIVPFRSHLWLPEFLMRRRITSARLVAGLRRLEGPAAWIDARADRRLQFLVVPPLALLPQIACVLCGALMPFLELVPFSSSILATAVVFFCLSLLARDGLFALAGLLIAGLGAAIPITVVLAATGN